ncbi:MAG: DegT/DnrJ/EryC1/StrS family aminotransferase [Acidobacteria bacterium]|nr:DegT/DnrJ/EryC1/StrS family aminotransferase [Acidobacteriota bacterium]
MKTAVTEVERSLIVQIEPWIDDSELQELRRVINSTFLVEHDLTKEFESLTAQFTGAKHAIAVCNGSMALFVCLKALGIGPGDEVIVPNLTFIASATSVILAGATPVLCEVREDTFCIDIESAERALTSRTKAVMPVHLYGQSADMDQVLAFASRHQLKVIEDAAEGIGVRFIGKHIGTFGDMGIISYYGNKTVTCGEGGMILTDDDDLAKAAYRLKNYGRDRKGTYVHESIGFNFSFTDLQAAIGIAQMKKFSRIAQKKKQIRERYINELRDVECFTPVYIDSRCDPVFWFTSFLCERREQLVDFLHRKNVQTRRFFCPLHRQPCFRNPGLVITPELNYKASDSIYDRGISLPSSYNLTVEQQSFVVEQIRGFYAGRN